LRFETISMVRVEVKVRGIVQGVGFRPFVYRTALHNHLTGYVRNRGDAGVEILVEGENSDVESFTKDLKEKKPPLAQIYEISITKLGGENQYKNFIILRSSQEAEFSGSVIPPDVAICEDCLKELRDPKNPRHDYFFITCTNCGPRYTAIETLPYDRDNTTMQDFPMCDFCRSQYENPSDRRFHAQTVACPICGPKAYLTDNKGKLIDQADPIPEAGRLISQGLLVAVKGYGGFHIAASTLIDEPLLRLRAVKHRREKPFAIMARSLDAINSFARFNHEEAELLTHHTRPIVLLRKNAKSLLSRHVAPGLHNVGVMLPYTGLHYMLFDGVKDSAFVMTSANPPNEPIIMDNDEALETLGDVVDYFVFHNRRLAYRCDDSVLRAHGERQVFLRRSRGYAPAPIILTKEAKQCVVGLGAEQNNTLCILSGNKAFISQHIGDVENIETRDFLVDVSQHLIHLTNAKVEKVACDLHPKFVTTTLAHDLAEEKGWSMVQVQHHHAHIGALMAENGLEETIGISCDGYGYGLDAQAWGGEILHCVQDSNAFQRLGHLQEQPLIGGDLATRYPLRIAAGILYGRVDLEDWLMANKEYFPHGEDEINLLLNQIKHGHVKKTTSCGRVLDAAAAMLGVCHERTYEGEPAMKLESLAMNGKDVLNLKPIFRHNVLDTTEILVSVFENKEKYSKSDLAYSVHNYLAQGFAEMAMEKAVETGTKTIGFSGGVACNEILALNMREIITRGGLRFVTHELVPPGDGGLSLGQAYAAALS